jgi:hypothetical protein
MNHGIATCMSGPTNAFAAMFPTLQFVREIRPDQEGIHQLGLHNSLGTGPIHARHRPQFFAIVSHQMKLLRCFLKFTSCQMM